MSHKFVKENKIVVGVAPQDLDGVAGDGSTSYLGDRVCMKNYNRLTVIIQSGLCPDVRAVTMKQSTDATNSLSDEKAITFTEMFANVAFASQDTLTKTTVTANTFNMAATSYNMYIIEITAADLDVDNSFDWVRVDIATATTSASIQAVLYILSEPRFAQETMPVVIS